MRILKAAVTALCLAAVAACQPTDPRWRVTLAGASAGGAWSAIGEALTDELRQGIPHSAFTLEPGQDGANAVLVQRGDVALGLVHSSLALAAVRGDPPYDAPQPDVRGLMLIYADAPFHFVVDKRSGITRIEDIRARHLPARISVNTRGSLMEIGTRTMLDAYGIGYEGVEANGGAIDYFPFNETYDSMKNGRMDALGATVQVPSSHAIEASRTLSLDILSLSDEAIAYCNAHLGTERTVIPKGSYPFLDHDVQTFAGRVILITSAKVPDDQVYEMTKVLYERLARLRRAHRSLKDLTPQTMPQVGGVPLHPGAARFYREIGVIR